MFRRHWSGLPKDAAFPSDLKGLGCVSPESPTSQTIRRLNCRRYFINDKDEIRSIENPDNYFNFYLDRNERINQRQRFQFDSAKDEPPPSAPFLCFFPSRHETC